MLRQHRADTGRAIGTTRADGDRGRGHRGADLAGAGAAADEGEGHGLLMLRSVELLDPGTAAALDDGKKRAAAGYTQLATSVILLSSAWPLTKIALSLGSTPLWFAEGRAVLSGVTIAVILTLRGRLRVPRREDLPELLAGSECII